MFAILVQTRSGLEWHAMVESTEEAREQIEAGDFDADGIEWVFVVPAVSYYRGGDTTLQVRTAP